MSETNENTLKILVLGDTNVGKTSLLLSYLVDNYSNQANDGLIDIYKCEVVINSCLYKISFTDPNGSDEEKLSELRKLNYILENNVDVILLCFSLVDRNSFLNITKKWYPEIRQHFQFIPIILVGTKHDLKQQFKNKYHLKKLNDSDTSLKLNENEFIIRRKECLLLKKLINAKKFLVCSRIDEKSIKKCINSAIENALRFSKQKLANKLNVNKSKNCC